MREIRVGAKSRLYHPCFADRGLGPCQQGGQVACLKPNGPYESVFTMTSPTLNLTGQLLVAMPGMGDPRFAHSVIYLTAHSKDGAMGLMVNKPAPELKLSDVLDKLVDGAAYVDGTLGVHIGGSVENRAGFGVYCDEKPIAKEKLGGGEGF